MIQLLSPSLQNQIAAGEVIERPESVVKELVENAIDAGATEIVVSIEEGGLKEIRIVDNGKGMNEQDAIMSFQRYATSKISTADDLFALSSFGFRGEAMAAISSVSHCTIRTKQENALHGVEVINAGDATKIGIQKGTEVIVKNLFWNVPARKKFMKTAETESREILKTMEQFALSHPLISFQLENNGKQIFSVPVFSENNPFLSRCKKVLGDSISASLLPVQFLGEDTKIEGFCSHPSLHRSSKDKQFFFVNGRMITKDSIFSACIMQAYQSLLPNGKHPVVILSLSLPPDQVDVNVHPRKKEVKFSNPSHIFQIIKGALEKALSHKTIYEKERENPIPFSYHSQNISHKTSEYHFPKSEKYPQSPPLSQSFSFFENQETPHHAVHEKSWKIIGQARNSFIIVEENDGIRIIDQHAAHERVRYEAFMNALENKTVQSQPLLTPAILSFSTSEKQQLLESQKELEAFGFSIDDFEGNEIAITAVPVGSEHINLQTLFSALLADLDFFDPHFGRELKRTGERIVSYAACRGSKKFGDALTMLEMEQLIHDWKSCKNPDSCAHGRRVSSFYPFKEIENECGRY